VEEKDDKTFLISGVKHVPEFIVATPRKRFPVISIR